MPKRTSNSSVNSSIRQNTAATEEGMGQLLSVQREALGELSSIRDLLESNKDEDTKTKDNLQQFSEDLTKTLSSIKTIPTAKEQFKSDFESKFGSISSTLDTLGLAKKGAGTMVSNWAEKVDDRKQFVKDQKELGSEKSDKELKADYAQSQAVAKNIKGNEGEITRLKAAGMSDTHEHMQGLLGKRQELTSSYSALDKRVGGNTESVIQTSKGDTEASMEASRAAEDQTDLLKKIAENTGANANSAKAKPNAEKSSEGGGGILDGIMSMLGSSILNAAKFLFNPKNLLKAFTKFLLPAMIIGSLVNGIIDGFKAFVETGSIAEALIAGFGGILSFLTFGLIDSETIRSVVDWFSGFIDDFIIQPLKDFFGFLGKAFDKYIAQPIMDAMSALGDMLNEYIVKPIKTFFAPIANFFKNIKEQVFGFLEDFGIPEVGFTIPIIGKKVSIGPFYPFRPEQGSNRVSSGAEMSDKSSAGGEESKFKQNVITSGQDAYRNKETGDTYYKEDKTRVLTTNEKNVNGKATFQENFAEFDPRTGKAMLSGDAAGEAGTREISKRAFSKIKASAKENGDGDKLAEIVKEDDAYQKLSFFDKMKVDVGYAKATDLSRVDVMKPTSATQVATKSAENAGAAMQPAAAGNSTVVSAPTINNVSKQTNIIKSPIRNQESTLSTYVNSRYVF